MSKSKHPEFNPPIEPLQPKAKECAQRLLNADKVFLASHIDADGITSASIASQMLTRANIEHAVNFYKQLDKEHINSIAATDYETVLFTDFGSGQLDIITDYEADGAFTPVISDHHEPADEETQYHLNPILFGISGSSELSGAGTTYCLARAMSALQDDPEIDHPTHRADNKDLAGMAIVGAIGDMQGGDSGVQGANTKIVAEGVEAGVLETNTDLTLYGKQTRPVPKLLEYSTDIRLPGITGSESGAIEFLNAQDVDITDDDGDWKHWVDLTTDEKQAITSGLINVAIESGVPSSRIDSLIGETYTLPNEPEKTHLRNVGEFSTLLNSTGRYEECDVGLAVCMGDRDEAYTAAKTLLQNHQKNISQGIEWVTNEGVTKESHIQWFDAGDQIKETIVGIIAGMALGEGSIDQHTPIIAFAEKSDDESDSEEDDTIDEVKISSRATRKLTRQGLDLSIVMKEASQHCSGDGGGHDIAAGATIPAKNQAEFVEKANEIVKEQTS